MKGFATHIANEYISHVNSASFFEKIGLQVYEYNLKEIHEYTSSIKIKVLYTKSSFLMVEGTVFNEVIIRLTYINNYKFEI